VFVAAGDCLQLAGGNPTGAGTYKDGAKPYRASAERRDRIEGTLVGVTVNTDEDERILARNGAFTH